MTMPEFKPVAYYIHNSEELIEDIRRANAAKDSGLVVSNFYNADQLQQAYAAGQAELVAVKGEIVKLQGNYKKYCERETDILMVEQQLATSQAHIEQLREAIALLRCKTDPKYGIPIADKALSIQPDNVLREHDAKLMNESVPALLFEAFDYGQFADDFDQPLAKPIRRAIREMLSAVDKIRKGKFNV